MEVPESVDGWFWRLIVIYLPEELLNIVGVAWRREDVVFYEDVL